MKKLLFFLLGLLLLNCQEKTKADPEQLIQVGMKYEEVIKMIGKPTDSISYRNGDGNLIHKLQYRNYRTFSDYEFGVVLNDSLKVVEYYYD